MADILALEAFVAVARRGSVVGAATHLGRTQPSISARLAALEAAWKTKLFRRHARGMSLTPEGAELLGLAEAALQSLEAVDRAAGRPLSEEQEIRVGSGDALGREVLPRALARLRSERPELALRVVEGARPRLIEAVRTGEVDVALVTVEGAKETERGIDRTPLLESRIDLLVKSGERTRAGGLRKLAEERIVTLQPGSSFRRHLELAFSAKGLSFQPAVEVGNLSLVRRFVAAGLGVAPVPAIAFHHGDRGTGVVRTALQGIEPLRYAAVSRSGVPHSRAVTRLLQFLR